MVSNKDLTKITQREAQASFKAFVTNMHIAKICHTVTAEQFETILKEVAEHYSLYGYDVYPRSHVGYGIVSDFSAAFVV